MSDLYEVNLSSSFTVFTKDTKFLVGGSLGRLARFLRIIGYNTLYEENNEERDLVKHSMAEGRIILTKAQDIAMNALDKSIGIIKFSSKVTDFKTQLALLSKCGVILERPQKNFRCTDCNSELQFIEKGDIEKMSLKKLIPPQSWETYNRFYYCKQCNKMYWIGTHWQKIELTLKKAKERADKNAF
jgi:hypothetical protein